MPILSNRDGARGAISIIFLLAGLVAGCAAPAEHPALQQADAALEQARSSARVRALAAADLDRAEVALEQARAAARAGASPDQVEHLTYVVRQRAALAEARATERVARSEVDVLQSALDQVEQDRHGRGSFAQRDRRRPAPQQQARASLAQGKQQQRQDRLPIEGDQQIRAAPDPNDQARAPVGDDQHDRASVADDPEDRASVNHDQGEGATATEVVAAGAAMPQDITLRLAQLPFDGAEPTSETGVRLAAVAERLLREPERSVSIEADFDLPDPEARTVMERRVEVVRAILLQRGIAPARLVVRAGGAGPAQPHASPSFVEAP